MNYAGAAPLELAGSPVLVLGLGNTLLGDDGVGVHVVRQLAAELVPTGLCPIDGGTLGFRLMDALARYDSVLLVDAAELGEPAGVVRVLERDQLDVHVRGEGRLSAHEAGVANLLTLARLEGCMPTRLALLGIQPSLIAWDETLSPTVERAVPHACRLAIETVLRWQAAL